MGQNEDKTELVLPHKNTDNERVIQYLTRTRCIDRELIENLIYKGVIYQDDKSNCVFLGCSGDGTVRHVSLRSTKKNSNKKIDVIGSEKQYSFSLKGSSNTVNVFESTIDLLSFITIFKEEVWIMDDGFVSLGGVGRQALRRFLKEDKNIRIIRVCTDNDDAGNVVGLKIYKEFGKQYRVIRRKPHLKDYNEDLCQKNGKHRKKTK